MMTPSPTQARNPFGKSFIVYANQSLLAERNLGSVIRFTADNRTKTVYGWDFNEGHHSDASHALGLNDKFSDPDFLRGAAEKINGKFVFIASDFFASFKGRVLKEDRRFLTELFSRDWSWIDEYIEVTGTLHRFKESLRL